MGPDWDGLPMERDRRMAPLVLVTVASKLVLLWLKLRLIDCDRRCDLVLDCECETRIGSSRSSSWSSVATDAWPLRSRFGRSAAPYDSETLGRDVAAVAVKLLTSAVALPEEFRIPVLADGGTISDARYAGIWSELDAPAGVDEMAGAAATSSTLVRLAISYGDTDSADMLFKRAIVVSGGQDRMSELLTFKN